APGEPPTTVASRVVPSKVVHSKVNIKLVCFIPYIGNDLPLMNRILPSPLDQAWQKNMTFTEDGAIKTVLASGNPDPPSDFPNQAEFNAFVQSNEYRAILDLDLLICCDLNGVDSLSERSTPYPGYTPALSGVDVKDLHKDHEAHESPAG